MARIVLLLMMLVITGCRGCSVPTLPSDENADTKKPEAAPLRRLSIDKLRALPLDSNGDSLLVKPGYWYELQQTAKANLGDESLAVNGAVVDNLFRPIGLSSGDSFLEFNRRLALASGQSKSMELDIFIPALAPINRDSSLNRSSVRVTYSPRSIGASIREEVYPITIMPDYQFYCVVLSDDSERFQFMNGMSSFIWPAGDRTENEKITPSRIVQVSQKDVTTSLPSQLNTWSTTSHLFWCGCSLSSITENQQTAIIDWLHMGGQIIVDGYDSQAAIKSSFLEPYLPLKNLASADPTTLDWPKWNEYWTITAKDQTRQELKLPSDRVLSMVSGDLTEDASWVVPTEGFIAQRNVGAGRVLMTTFPMGEDVFVRWNSYGSLINGALLNRPPRIWNEANGFGDLTFAPPYSGKETDPSISTRFRLMGRDLGIERPQFKPSGTQNSRPKIDVASDSTNNSISVNMTIPFQTLEDENQTPNRTGPGIGLIENQSPIPISIVGSLREASGINVPKIATIAKLLGAYLLILVPINWTVFRLINRLELAWIAAPIIAMVGAFVIARSVQLDIGFSRSEKTIQFLEIPCGYSRGHLTSFTSLYTSLSTNYQMRQMKNSGFAMPLLGGFDRSTRNARSTNGMDYDFGNANGDGINSFPVRSNSTSIVQSEEMLQLEGEIELSVTSNDVVSYKNQTQFDLHDAVIIKWISTNEIRCGQIGDIPSGGQGQVQITESINYKSESTDSKSDPTSGEILANTIDQLSLGVSSESNQLLSGVFKAVVKKYRPTSDEPLLLARIKSRLGSLVITPISNQTDSEVLIAVHSKTAAHPIAAPDHSLPGKVDYTEEDEPPEF